MSMHEREATTFRQLSAALNELLLEYGDELGDLKVTVTDELGLMDCYVKSVDLAGGLFIITDNEDT